MFSLMPRNRDRTSLVRRDMNPLEWFRRELAPLWNFPIWGTWEAEPQRFEVEERENELVLRAEVPGFEMSELEVTVQGNELTVRAEHKEGENGEAKERRYARLERTVTLPAGIEPEKVEARYRNGILEVHVPRTPEAQPRRIEVKT